MLILAYRYRGIFGKVYFLPLLVRMANCCDLNAHYGNQDNHPIYMFRERCSSVLVADGNLYIRSVVVGPTISCDRWHVGYGSQNNRLRQQGNVDPLSLKDAQGRCGNQHTGRPLMM